MENFAEAIGLSENWPVAETDEDQMDHCGYMSWAQTYVDAAEKLHFNSKPRNDNLLFYTGPVVHLTGLCTELTIKTLLRGAGFNEKQLRKFGHNTYKAYHEAREMFDEIRFINLISENSQYLELPAEIRDKPENENTSATDRRWRVYFGQLQLLDLLYDKPFRNRYPTPGSIVAPETEIILLGTRILLAAMNDRLSVIKIGTPL